MPVNLWKILWLVDYGAYWNGLSAISPVKKSMQRSALLSFGITQPSMLSGSKMFMSWSSPSIESLRLLSWLFLSLMWTRLTAMTSTKTCTSIGLPCASLGLISLLGGKTAGSGRIAYIIWTGITAPVCLLTTCSMGFFVVQTLKPLFGTLVMNGLFWCKYSIKNCHFSNLRTNYST